MKSIIPVVMAGAQLGQHYPCLISDDYLKLTPQLTMQILPFFFSSGIIAIYGLVVAVLIAQQLDATGYSLFKYVISILMC